MLCGDMYETIDKTWVCEPLYVMGYILMFNICMDIGWCGLICIVMGLA